MKAHHPWILSGPWYREESAGGIPDRPDTRPILQKYASPEFMTQFLEEPQKSLRFVCEDYVHRLCADVTEISDPGSGDRLKLFLDLHNRFYLVVCQLHCAAPGYPRVTRDQVCEAGLVVRRRVPGMSPAARGDLLALMQDKHRVYGKLQQIAKQYASGGTGLKYLKSGTVRKMEKAAAATQRKKVAELERELQTAEKRIRDLLLKHKFTLSLQGWIPGEHHGVGSWQDVGETPPEIRETVHPLYALTPDPKAKCHTGENHSIWYGLVPTQSLDVDAEGSARFDDQTLYEIRCFVRRHKPECPKKPGRRDCPGELVWSRPTEAFQLAAPMDFDGTAHRPINIKLPDIPALKAKTLAAKPGRGANVRMIAPPNSKVSFESDGNDIPSSPLGSPSGGQQICFFAIPLVTIVALFVLNLFLPIVMFLFGLFFLLKLKFCIPPSFSFDAGVAADLKAMGPDIEAAVDLKIDAGLTVKLGTTDCSTKAQVKTVIKNSIDPAGRMDKKLLPELRKEVDKDLNGTVDLVLDAVRDFRDQPEKEIFAAKLPLVTEGLVYFNKVPVS